MFDTLSFTDVRQLNENNLCEVFGDYWIFTQREKNEQPVKILFIGQGSFYFGQVQILFGIEQWEITSGVLQSKDKCLHN